MGKFKDTIFEDNLEIQINPLESRTQQQSFQEQLKQDNNILYLHKVRWKVPNKTINNAS